MVVAVGVGMGGAEAEAAMRLPAIGMRFHFVGFGSLFENAHWVLAEGSAAAAEGLELEWEMAVDMRSDPQDLSGDIFLRLWKKAIDGIDRKGWGSKRPEIHHRRRSSAAEQGEAAQAVHHSHLMNLETRAALVEAEVHEGWLGFLACL